MFFFYFFYHFFSIYLLFLYFFISFKLLIDSITLVFLFILTYIPFQKKKNRHAEDHGKQI